MPGENIEAVRALFDRFGEIDFARLREALETSSSLREAAPKIGGLGQWSLDRLHPSIELDATALPAVPEGNRASGHQGEYSTPICNVWTLQNGQVVRLQMFPTWEEAMEAAERPG